MEPTAEDLITERQTHQARDKGTITDPLIGELDGLCHGHVHSIADMSALQVTFLQFDVPANEEPARSWTHPTDTSFGLQSMVVQSSSPTAQPLMYQTIERIDRMIWKQGSSSSSKELKTSRGCPLRRGKRHERRAFHFLRKETASAARAIIMSTEEHHNDRIGRTLK